MAGEKIKVAIAGYGNLGKGIENELNKNTDMELVCIFTRREPETLKIKSNVPIVREDEIGLWKNKIDIVFLCGGSAKDLEVQGPKYASLFNTVDSFDTHAKAKEYLAVMDNVAKKADKLAMSSIGWDPGLFSYMRLLIKSVLPNAKIYTFWGKGISQGHSEAIRQIEGVVDARQYTVPVENTLKLIRSGKMLDYNKRQMHERVCYVVANKETNKDDIEKKIKNMPYYFDEYNTTVNFVSQQELDNYHSKLSHGGIVIGVGETSKGSKQSIEFTLNLDSNPEFTASVLIAYGRATYKMWENGERGSRNFSDVSPKYLIQMSYADIASKIL